MSAETKNVVNIIKLLASGVIVVLIAFGIAFLFNSGIDFYTENKLDNQLKNITKAYSDSELAALREHNEALSDLRATRKELENEILKIEAANKELMGGNAPKQGRSDGELTEKQQAYLDWLAAWDAYYQNQADYTEYLSNLDKYNEMIEHHKELVLENGNVMIYFRNSMSYHIHLGMISLLP